VGNVRRYPGHVIRVSEINAVAAEARFFSFLMSSFGRAALSGLLDVREMFYTNLLLLGFDSATYEEKFRIPVNRDMFVLPNKKGMEVVMHFLFNRLDSHLCYEEFRDCWPVLDKKQEQQFRKTCTLWLSRIAKENKEVRFPRIVASLFMSPGGQLCFIFHSNFSI
jgi:HAUS augmin-like complex subunit 6